MGRPNQCNPCCGEWYTTEKLTYDSGALRSVFADFFYNHPQATDENNIYYGTGSKARFDDFHTWGIYPNLIGGVTVFTKDNLKEIPDINFSKIIDGELVQYDPDAPDILPNTRRYNSNLGLVESVFMDYGTFGEYDQNDFSTMPKKSIYYRNYKNPVIDNDIIWYQNIVDNLADYDFETVYNAAFANINPTYRDIPAQHVWEDGEYTLVNYDMYDGKIYCLIRLGKSFEFITQQDSNITKVYDSLFVFTLDYNYDVTSFISYQSDVISDTDEVLKMVFKNNKLYCLVKGTFTAPNRRYDFVIIDLTTTLLQDAFTGGVTHVNYYTSNHLFRQSEIAYTGGSPRYITLQDAIDNEIVLYVSSETSNIIEMEFPIHNQQYSDWHVHVQVGCTANVEFGPVLVGRQYQRAVITVDSDNANVVFRNQIGSLGNTFISYRFKIRTFLSGKTIQDFDVDSNGDIYLISHQDSGQSIGIPTFGVYNSISTNQNLALDVSRTLNKLGSLNPDNTEFADVLKIDGTTGKLLKASVYANNVLYTNIDITMTETEEEDSVSDRNPRSNTIAVADDKVWVGGSQIWPSLGILYYDTLEFSDYYQIDSFLTGSNRIYHLDINRQYFLFDTESISETNSTRITTQDAFAYVPAWNTDAINVYQGGMVWTAYSLLSIANPITFPATDNTTTTVNDIYYDIPYNVTCGSLPMPSNTYSITSCSGGPPINNHLSFTTKQLNTDGYIVVDSFMNIGDSIFGYPHVPGGINFSNVYRSESTGNTEGIPFMYDTGSFPSLSDSVNFSQTRTPLIADYPYNILVFDTELELLDKYYYGPKDMNYERKSSSNIMFDYSFIRDMVAVGDNVYVTASRRHDVINTSTGRTDRDEIPE